MGKSSFAFLFLGLFFAHTKNRMSVSFTDLVKERSFWQQTGKEVLFSGSHDTGNIIVNYFIMWLKQTKQQVCALGLFSLMPSAARGMQRYWAEFGNIAAFFPSHLLKCIYALSLLPHSKNWWSLGTCCRGGKADGQRKRSLSGVWAGHGALWESWLWGRGMVQCRSGGESVPGCHQLPCRTGSAAPCLLVLISHSFPWEWASCCSIPVPNTATSSQVTCSALFPWPAPHTVPPPSLRNHQIKVLCKTG